MKALPTRDPLLLALRDPSFLTQLSDSEWRDLLPRARHWGLLGRLAVQARDSGLLDRIPLPAKHQFDEARVYAERNQTDIRFEVDRLARTLAPVDTPIILLKGGAYVMAGLPPARGRLSSDLDIMVPKSRLSAVEQELLGAGWESMELSDYDEHYYRDWMHEIPPLWHSERQVVIDIHHTILPITSRYQPDADALLAAAVPLDGQSLKTLCPADMVLHSAVHLFTEEFYAGLRDLTDLNDLLTHFGTEDEFWDTLLARARLHGLERTLYYLIAYTSLMLATEVAPRIEAAVQDYAPAAPVRPAMDLLLRAALSPAPAAGPRPGQAFALWLLFVRSHWLKMPPWLLAQHLTVKAYRRWQKKIQSGPSGSEARPH